VVSFGRAIHVWLIRQGDLIRDNKRKSILRECLYRLREHGHGGYLSKPLQVSKLKSVLAATSRRSLE
jgi:hypothetical protein